MKPFIIAALAILGLTLTVGEQSDSETLSPELEEALRWLPEDIDALVVAEDYSLRKPKLGPEQRNQSEISNPDISQLFRALADGRFLRAHEELKSSIKTLFQSLEHHHVVFAMQASRDFFPDSSFGSCGYAGCHITQFAEPLGDAANAIAALLREKASKIITVAGREVAAFDGYPFQEDTRRREWARLMVVVPQPDDRNLFIATEQTMLTDVLTRRADAALTRVALPADLPAWRHIDFAASGWGILSKPPSSDDSQSPRTHNNVITFEYHKDEASSRFVVRCSPEQVPESVATLKVEEAFEPEAADQSVAVVGLLQFLAGQEVAHTVERPAGEPAKITVPIKDLSDVMGIAFPVAAIFQHCIEP